MMTYMPKSCEMKVNYEWLGTFHDRIYRFLLSVAVLLLLLADGGSDLEFG